MSKQIDESVLFEALISLGESAQKVVLVGGWCPYLYAKYLWKIPMQYLPRTTDIDIGVHETGSGQSGEAGLDPAGRHCGAQE